MFVASIVPKAVVEEIGDEAFSSSPVGSGPFQLVSWNRGERLELARNPNYWRAPMPYLDGVVIDFVQDDNTRLLRVENGEAHLAEDVPYAQIERVDAIDGVSVVAEEVFKWDAIWLNTAVPPLDDHNVRLALNYATPKEDILESILFGRADIANHIIARVKYWDESVPAYAYDLEMAQQLMAESSAPDGFDLTMLIPAGDSTELQMAQVIQAAWAEIGVNVTLEPVDLGTAFGTWLGEDPTAAMSSTFPGSALSSDTLSDDNLLFVFLVPDTGLRSFGTNYDDPEVVQLIRDGNATFDEEVRSSSFAQAQALAMEAAPAVPLFFTNARTAVRDEAQGFHTFRMGWWPLWEVWLAE
jgi:peptide/nickel transport system substrate-binding protein